VALVHEPLAHLPGHLGLRATDDGAGGDGLDDAVGRLGSLPHEDQLVGVLGAPQRCQQR
jgi:hypothetical protein